jgi:hypothetical protein
MHQKTPLLQNKLYKVITTEGELLGDWFYIEEVSGLHIFHLAAVHGVEIKIKTLAMNQLRFL